MSIPLSKTYDGKKFMWDGAEYETEDQARQRYEAYQKAGFDVQVSRDADTYLVYSRRVAVKQT